MITFDKETHTYTNDGCLLLSVTEVLKRYVFPDLYSNVPEETLNEAAKRGTEFHSIVERYIKREASLEELYNRDLGALLVKADKELMGLNESEIVVSDGQMLAGTIDVIGNIYRPIREDYGVYKNYIADIKTTRTLNIEYVQWQLSLYLYLYVGEEKYNDKDNRPELYAFHVRDGRCKVVKIEPLPWEHVSSILNAIGNNVAPEDWVKPERGLLNVKTLTEQYRAAFEQRASLQKQIKELDEEIDGYLAEIKHEFLSIGTYKESFDDVEISLPADTIRRTFDKAKFEKRYPELKAELDECVKEIMIEGKIKIKFKNGTQD